MRRDSDGVPNNLSTTNGGTFYEPEQDVIAFGVGTDFSTETSAAGHSTALPWNNKTSSKRKFLVGDKLFFVSEGIATESHRVRGVVQIFCKS